MARRKKTFDAEHFKPKTINVTKFNAYAKRHGSDRAVGYHDALKDMANNIEGLFYKYAHGEYYFYNSPYVVHGRLQEFKEEIDRLLVDIEKAKDEKSKQSPGKQLDPNN